jgi:hypothetical protein
MKLGENEKMMTKSPCISDTVVERLTTNPEFKGSNPPTAQHCEIGIKKDKEKMSCSCSTMVVHSTTDPEFKGSNPPTTQHCEIGEEKKMMTNILRQHDRSTLDG